MAAGVWDQGISSWRGVHAGTCYAWPLPADATCATVARHAFYGIGPVVVGIFAVAVYRLARGTIRLRAQLVIGIAAALLMLLSSVGLTVTLLAAGCIGVALFYSRRAGLIALAVLAALFAGYAFAAAECGVSPAAGTSAVLSVRSATKYTGRPLISDRILPIYSPTIPIMMSWTPPSTINPTTTDG